MWVLVMLLLMLLLVLILMLLLLLVLILMLVLVLMLMSPLGILHNLQHLPDQYELNERLLHKCQQFFSS